MLVSESSAAQASLFVIEKDTWATFKYGTALLRFLATRSKQPEVTNHSESQAHTGSGRMTAAQLHVRRSELTCATGLLGFKFSGRGTPIVGVFRAAALNG